MPNIPRKKFQVAVTKMNLLKVGITETECREFGTLKIRHLGSKGFPRSNSGREVVPVAVEKAHAMPVPTRRVWEVSKDSCSVDMAEAIQIVDARTR